MPTMERKMFWGALTITYALGANILNLSFSPSHCPKDVHPGSPDEPPLSAAFDFLEILPTP